jgi:predicted GNAT family N-acyltransferase
MVRLTMALLPAAKITTWARDGAELSALRQAVFVGEQGVPAALEFDALDAQPKRTAHALIRDEAGLVIATGRLVLTRESSTPTTPAIPRIGRMAVSRELRGQGAGGQVLQALCAHAQCLGYTEVLLHAQAHAAGFYAAHGFVQFGEQFTEANILHVEMRKKLVQMAI